MRDKFKPSVCGIGFIGEGSHMSSINRKLSRVYVTWSNMIRRCYSASHQKDKPSYIGCVVCPEWHNFQVFADWFFLNYTDGLHLDKDILKQGNRVYSPDTCVFVSYQVNSLFINRKRGRGKCRLGVSWSSGMKKFVSNCRDNGELKHLGYYTSEVEAHEAYKKYKYKLITGASVAQADPIKAAMINYVIPEY